MATLPTSASREADSSPLALIANRRRPWTVVRSLGAPKEGWSGSLRQTDVALRHRQPGDVLTSKEPARESRRSHRGWTRAPWEAFSELQDHVEATWLGLTWGHWARLA